MPVFASIWQQLKADVIKNGFRRTRFLRNSKTASQASSALDNKPSVWFRIREAFGAQSFSDFIPFDECVVDNEQVTNEEVNTPTEGRSQLSPTTDSEQKK